MKGEVYYTEILSITIVIYFTQPVWGTRSFLQFTELKIPKKQIK